MNTERLEARRATLEETERILDLMQAFYSEDKIAFHKERARKSVRELLSKPQYGAILLLTEAGTTDAGEQEQALGFMVLTLCFTLEHGGIYVLLDELYLQEPLRGRGLGQAAIDLACQWAKEQGADAMRLEVHNHNPRAKALYIKNGFEDDHRDILTLWL